MNRLPLFGKVSLTAIPDQASIQVEDSGEGIASYQLNYFQKVFSGKLKPRVGSHGMGLGLLLINDFALRNGAVLSLNSQIGQGTTISVQMQLGKTVEKKPTQYVNIN